MSTSAWKPRLSRKQWIFLAFIGLALDLWWLQRAPSEEAMQRTFFEHRREFDELQALALSETNSGDNRFAPGERAPTARRTRAVELMYQLGISTAYFNRREEGPYQGFYVFGGGFTDTSWSIGYAYSRAPLSPIVPRAYAMPDYARTGKTRHFAPLDGGWYIYNSH